jgi:hypothetical protein
LGIYPALNYNVPLKKKNMRLDYFKSKKNGNYIVACAGKKLIIGFNGLTEEQFQSGVANAEGHWAGDNYLVGFAGNGGSIEVASLKLGEGADLPVIEV